MAHHERPRTSLLRNLAFRLIALGGATLIALIVAEVGLRLFVEQEVKRLAIYDPEIGWRGRPNGRGVYVRQADDIRTPYRYNNIGYRDEDVTPKPEGARRMLILGDSFVENLEVDYTQTFPVLIESELERDSSAWDVAVVGSQGYSTSQELLAFRKFHQEIDPDLVVLFVYCGNDFEDNMRTKFAYLDDNDELQIPENNDAAWKTTLKRCQRWLYESSHLVFFTKNTIQSLANVELGPASKEKVKADEASKQHVTGRLLERMAKEVRATGAEFAIVAVPSRDHVAASDFDRVDFVHQWCEQNEVACLNLAPLLAKSHFFEHDFHFNIDGHQVVTHEVYDFVRDLPPREARVATRSTLEEPTP